MPACRAWSSDALAGRAMRRTPKSLAYALVVRGCVLMPTARAQAPQPAAVIVEQACSFDGPPVQPSAPSKVLSLWAGGNARAGWLGVVQKGALADTQMIGRPARRLVVLGKRGPVFNNLP